MKPPKNEVKSSSGLEVLYNEVGTGSEQRGCFWKVKKILNPPIYAALVAIPLALIPGCKNYVFTGSGSVFVNNLTQWNFGFQGVNLYLRVLGC